jgi:hypothetical protein
VAKELRDRGFKAIRGQYVNDVLFDIVIENGKPETPRVIEVLSFGGDRKDWTPVEHDAGHFLFGRREAGVDARAIIHPPTSGNGASESYRRVSRWLDHEDVPTVTLQDFLQTPQQSLDLAEPVTT